jgi:hypothetical protein
VFIPGALISSFLLYFICVVVDIPPPQLPGHGRLMGSLPSVIPPDVVFPLPNRLPPPEVASQNESNKPPKRKRPNSIVDEYVAQVPVDARPENKFAPHALPERDLADVIADLQRQFAYATLGPR